MKAIIAITASLFSVLTLNAQVLITGFGSSEFVIDSGTTDFASTSQNGTTSNAIGTDSNIFAGTFTPVDISGYSSITLTAAVNGTNPGSQFSVDLYNSDFSQSRTYNAFLSSFGSSQTSVALTFVSQTAAFSTIGGFVFTGTGGGSALNITFDSLTAVPEPATWALIAGGLTTVMVLRRRRK